MSLPNVNITLGNGNIGTVTLSDDGISGLILTGRPWKESSLLTKCMYFLPATTFAKAGYQQRNQPFSL